jgi:Protein of unknown function (DUF3551)
MRRTTMILAIAVAALMLGATDRASAQTYWPWCLYYSAWTYNCGFATLQQCVASSIGAGGYCRPNPHAAPAARGYPPQKRKPVRRHHRT